MFLSNGQACPSKKKQLTQSERLQNSPVSVPALSVVLVFLVLAARYESCTSPAAVISVVPLSALGVIAAVTIAAADLNVYSQIGLVLLVALASRIRRIMIGHLLFVWRANGIIQARLQAQLPGVELE